MSHKVGDHSTLSFLGSDHREQIALALLYTVGKESNFHILRFIVGVCFSIQQQNLMYMHMQVYDARIISGKSLYLLLEKMQGSK